MAFRMLPRLVDRVAGVAVVDSDSERARLRKRALTVVVSLICVLSPLWIVTYLMLGRPTAGLIPAIYVVVASAGLAFMAVTKRDELLVASQVGMMLVLPFALQWVLGGFVQGSAVSLWSFAAVLVALVAWGPRRAALVFAGFVTLVVLSGLAEASLRAAVPPLPPAVEIGFFVLNLSAPLATAFALLLSFDRDRVAAMAASDALLDNILPAAVARQLKAGRRPIADRHEAATVGFIDLVGFTPFADRTPPERVVDVLDRAFSALDQLATRHGVEKIKTLGDGYLVAAGVTGGGDDHSAAVADMVLSTAAELRRCLGAEWPDVEIRVGVASGPVIAGVIGERRIGFDLWGDTVNTASRMASHAAPGQIQVTEAVRDALLGSHRFEPRGEIEVKGKGRMQTWILVGRQRAGP